MAYLVAWRTVIVGNENVHYFRTAGIVVIPRLLRFQDRVHVGDVELEFPPAAVGLQPYIPWDRFFKSDISTMTKPDGLSVIRQIH